MHNQSFLFISQKQKILTNFILCFSSGLIVPPGPICAITDLNVFSNYEERKKSSGYNPKRSKINMNNM